MTTKIHAICDGLGRPKAFHLTGGNASDLAGADVLLSGLKAKVLIGDKGYDASKRVRNVLTDRGIKVVIPPRANRVDQFEYDAKLYGTRHRIENLFSRMKDYRCVSTRYDKLAVTFLGTVCLVACLFWI